MKKFFKEFKEFASRGNVLELAIAVVIGAAFGKIVSSLVDDIIMPLVGILVGKNFASLTLEINGSYIAYGSFIQAIVNFLIIALCIFIAINTMKKAKERLEKRLKKEEDKKDEKKSAEVLLLEQIKDLLKKQTK